MYNWYKVAHHPAGGTHILSSRALLYRRHYLPERQGHHGHKCTLHPFARPDVSSPASGPKSHLAYWPGTPSIDSLNSCKTTLWLLLILKCSCSLSRGAAFWGLKGSWNIFHIEASHYDVKNNTNKCKASFRLHHFFSPFDTPNQISISPTNNLGFWRSYEWANQNWQRKCCFPLIKIKDLFSPKT